jgi:hypothetical protein
MPKSECRSGKKTATEFRRRAGIEPRGFWTWAFDIQRSAFGTQQG